MYKYVLNSVVKISMMFAKYFEYYTVILGEGAFFCGHAVCDMEHCMLSVQLLRLLRDTFTKLCR